MSLLEWILYCLNLGIIIPYLEYINDGSSFIGFIALDNVNLYLVTSSYYCAEGRGTDNLV